MTQLDEAASSAPCVGSSGSSVSGGSDAGDTECLRNAWGDDNGFGFEDDEDEAAAVAGAAAGGEGEDGEEEDDTLELVVQGEIIFKSCFLFNKRKDGQREA